MWGEGPGNGHESGASTTPTRGGRVAAAKATRLLPFGRGRPRRPARPNRLPCAREPARIARSALLLLRRLALLLRGALDLDLLGGRLLLLRHVHLEHAVLELRLDLVAL